MKITPFVVLAGLLAVGCTSVGRVDSAELPPGEYTASDVDQAALVEASHAVGTGGTRPDTVQGWARALGNVEYVSGAFNTHARWIGLDGSAQAQLMIARGEIRDAVGISRQAPSQAVVNALFATSHAADAGALQASLANPVFTLGPQATLARLEHMPSFFTTPYALAHTNIAIQEKDGTCNRLFC